MKLTTLPKHELQNLRRRIIKEMQRRYKKNCPPKYGALNKGFLEEELRLFFEHVDNPVAYVVFQLQANLGLRIGEAASIRQREVDLSQRRLWIQSEKDSVPTLFFLHDNIYTIMIEYYRNHASFLQGKEYLFPAQDPSNKTTHISPNWLRNYMRKICSRINLNFSYGTSEEAYEHKTPRKLYRISTHSLRHYFCRKVWVNTGDFYLTKKLSRHRNARHLERYIHVDQEEIDSALITTFRETQTLNSQQIISTQQCGIRGEKRINN